RKPIGGLTCRRARFGQSAGLQSGDFRKMRMVRMAAAAAMVLAFGLSGLAPRAWADEGATKSDGKSDKGADKKDGIELPPFPADASVKQVTHVAGKTLSYTATV